MSRPKRKRSGKGSGTLPGSQVAQLGLTIRVSEVLYSARHKEWLSVPAGTHTYTISSDGLKMLFANPFDCEKAATNASTWVIAMEQPETVFSFQIAVTDPDLIVEQGAHLLHRTYACGILPQHACGGIPMFKNFFKKPAPARSLAPSLACHWSQSAR